MLHWPVAMFHTRMLSSADLQMQTLLTRPRRGRENYSVPRIENGARELESGDGASVADEGRAVAHRHGIAALAGPQLDRVVRRPRDQRALLAGDEAVHYAAVPVQHLF